MGAKQHVAVALVQIGLVPIEPSLTIHVGTDGDALEGWGVDVETIIDSGCIGVGRNKGNFIVLVADFIVATSFDGCLVFLEGWNPVSVRAPSSRDWHR